MEYTISNKTSHIIKSKNDGKIDLLVYGDEVSDGYHTMSELYNHRAALYCALVKIYDNYITPLRTHVMCWKSKLHDDGTMYDGWFIVGMTIKKFVGPPEYISYHLPLSWWDKFNVIEFDKAPPYDGYTSDDVFKRLLEL